MSLTYEENRQQEAPEWDFDPNDLRLARRGSNVSVSKAKPTAADAFQTHLRAQLQQGKTIYEDDGRILIIPSKYRGK